VAILPDSLRVSEAAYEPRGLRFASVETTSFGGRGQMCLFVPPEVESTRGVPLCILLHGAYGSSWSWALRGGAHLLAGALMEAGEVAPMVIAMPSDGGPGASSGYFTQETADYEAWIMDDVPALVDLMTPCVDARSRLFLGGYSMGGFGALRLGAKHAGRVTGIAAHSSVVSLDDLQSFLVPGSRGPTPRHDGDRDVTPWLVKAGARCPPLRLDCGQSDPLLPANRRLSETLAAAGINHQFHEPEGAHDMDYWRARLPEALRFFDEILRGVGRP
jgi:enterochelin esterase-like enzyme